jgi:predicted PurR-regulated permease PerM
LIIAIAAKSPYEAFARGLGGHRGVAATILVVASLGVLVLPAVMLSETLVSGAQYFSSDLADGTLTVPPPPERVAIWPIVGTRIYELWQLASVNLEAAVEKLAPQLRAVSRWLLSAAGSVGRALLELVAALIISGVLLYRGNERADATHRIATRLAGPARGPALADLAVATVSSVVQGIVGVALIQSLLAGVAFIVAGIPGAGLWALLVLVAAVVQIPVGLVMIPPVLLCFSASSAPIAIAFTVWCLMIAALDNVLKPILFGRGVDVPMIVIFLGAIGGMLTMGIIGLFVGAVILGLGYELAKAWLQEDTGAEAGT